MSASRVAVLTVISLALFSTSFPGHGQTNTAAATAVTNMPVAPADLPKGAIDVVKLSQMGKKDNVLIFYINYSDLDYHLSADHIVYLKSAGLSSGVINAMLEIDKEHQKAMAVRTDEDRFFGRTDLGGAKPAAVASTAPVVESNAEYIPSVVYPDYSAFPTYYQTFDNSSHHHTSVAIGIGVGAMIGFDDFGFHHGSYGHTHFGGRH